MYVTIYPTSFLKDKLNYMSFFDETYTIVIGGYKIKKRAIKLLNKHCVVKEKYYAVIDSNNLDNQQFEDEATRLCLKAITHCFESLNIL